jgi:putative membrane protein
MHKERSLKQYAGITARGMMMGAADAVPGVSGGTIAFMTGIYEELIYSLKQCGPGAIKMLFSQGLKSAWQYINGTFLLALFGGVLLSLLSLSRLIIFLLDSYPNLLWAFFFGLILAGVWSVLRHVEKWTLSVITFFIIGVISAYWITTISPTTIESSPLIVFCSGMIAICAMILPGISGSFILLLLGMYGPMMLAVKEFQFITLSYFAAGCIIGLLSFSHVLSWMFKHYKTLTLALLGGFMFGSLNKVWPWKITLESVIDRHGKVVPLVQNNVLPHTFEMNTQEPAYLLYSLLLILSGIIMVIMLERFGNKAPQQT